MDISELKKLLKTSTSVLILENGEPSLVIMDYGSYRKSVGDLDKELEVKITHADNGLPAQAGAPVTEPVPVGQRLQAREAEILERLNKEIQTLKDEIELEEKRQSQQHQ